MLASGVQFFLGRYSTSVFLNAVYDIKDLKYSFIIMYEIYIRSTAEVMPDV
jgi:hypothetical protein